jgi:hypothetical protein
MPTVWTAIISGVFGIAAGSAVTAWAQWGIEKRRMKRQRQYNLLDSWRTGVADLWSDDHTKALGMPWYETLRPYLSDDVRSRLEKPRTLLVTPGSGRGIKDLFTGEVDRIELEWGIRP